MLRHLWVTRRVVRVMLLLLLLLVVIVLVGVHGALRIALREHVSLLLAIRTRQHALRGGRQSAVTTSLRPLVSFLRHLNSIINEYWLTATI